MKTRMSEPTVHSFARVSWVRAVRQATKCKSQKYDVAVQDALARKQERRLGEHEQKARDEEERYVLQIVHLDPSDPFDRLVRREL